MTALLLYMQSVISLLEHYCPCFLYFTYLVIIKPHAALEYAIIYFIQYVRANIDNYINSILVIFYLEDKTQYKSHLENHIQFYISFHSAFLINLR